LELNLKFWAEPLTGARPSINWEPPGEIPLVPLLLYGGIITAGLDSLLDGALEEAEKDGVRGGIGDETGVRGACDIMGEGRNKGVDLKLN
jgi:hypothetical protein